MRLLNVPNSLTLFRILLVPVVVVALLEETDSGSVIAAIVFAIAASTDGLDGYVARSRQSVTGLGRVMDPIADKLLIAAALISLVILDRLTPWVAIVIIAREFAVSGLRIWASRQGATIASSSIAKLKTGVQVVAVMALIVVSDTAAVWVDALVYAAVAITVISGVQYFASARREIGEARGRPLPAPRAGPR